MDEEKESLEYKISFSQRQIKSLDNDILKLKQEKDKLDKERNATISALRKDLESVANIIKQLEHLLKDSEQDNIKYRGKIKEVEEKNRDFQAHNSELQSENSYLSKEYVNQKNKKDQMVISLEQSNKDILELTKGLSSYKEKIDKLTLEVSDLKKSLNLAQEEKMATLKEKEKTGDKLANAKSELEKQEAKASTLSDAISALEKTNAGLSSSPDELRKENQKLKKQLSKFKKRSKIAEKEKRIEGLEKENAMLNSLLELYTN